MIAVLRRVKAKRREEMESSVNGGVREGVEVRKLHIVYFLCRNGKTEQPHLIRVHHLNRNGVHLRDVKRWLSELRGREMPEAFSWSYKRSYKAGYIWQDLVDGDLITPLSDNEYVLMGSILPSKTVEDLHPFQEINISAGRIQSMVVEKVEGGGEEEANMSKSNMMHETLQIDDNTSPKPPPSGDESPVKPPASPSIFEDNRNRVNLFTTDRWKEERCGNEVVIKKRGMKGDRRTGKGRSEGGHRRRAASFIKNIFWCKIVEAKDSVKNASPEHSVPMPQSNQRGSSSSNERKGWKKKGNRGSRKMTERAAATATHKPATEPNCSQCGKPFKPEKLHSHMTSCAALREKGRRPSFTGNETAAKTTAAAAGIRRPSKVTVTDL